MAREGPRAGDGSLSLARVERLPAPLARDQRFFHGQLDDVRRDPLPSFSDNGVDAGGGTPWIVRSHPVANAVTLRRRAGRRDGSPEAPARDRRDRGGGRGAPRSQRIAPRTATVVPLRRHVLGVGD